MWFICMFKMRNQYYCMSNLFTLDECLELGASDSSWSVVAAPLRRSASVSSVYDRPALSFKSVALYTLCSKSRRLVPGVIAVSMSEE
jgi:hypothetical protein